MSKLHEISQIERIIGPIIGLVTCLFCWGVRSVKVTNSVFFVFQHNQTYWISGMPSFGSTLFAIIAIIILYKRNIIDIGEKSKFTILALLADITILSTFLSLFMLDNDPDFFKSIRDNTILLIATTFFVAMILFGMRGMARLTFILYIIVCLCGTFSVINTALGFRGHLAILGFFYCFYVQDVVRLDSIGNEFHLLYGKTMSTIRSAGDEVENLGTKYTKSQNKVPVESDLKSNN